MRRRVALIGSPVAGSPSPAMHRAAARACGIDLEYRVVEVGQEGLAGALARLRRGHLGLNVTTPLKEAVLPLLDRLAPEARRSGSVNTVVFRLGGGEGHSTDGAGFLAALEAGGSRAPRRAVVLGTGGAARAVAAALTDRGVAVSVSGRNRGAGLRVASDLGVAFVPLSSVAPALPEADLLVNATPVGGPSEPGRSPLPEEVPLHPGLTVFDLVYRPLRTALLARAEREGCRTIPGVEMLVEQGVRSFELWTGVRPPAGPMRAAAEAHLRDHRGPDDPGSPAESDRRAPARRPR